MRWIGFLLAFLLVVSGVSAVDQAEILYLYERMPEPVRFAALELEEILRNKGFIVTLRDVHGPSPADEVFRVTVGDLMGSPQLPQHPLAADPRVRSASQGSFEIRVRKSGASAEVVVIGTDAAGAMYGLLDVAEKIDDQGTADAPHRAIRDGVHQPFLSVRGAQVLIRRHALLDPWSWFYSEEFWQGFLDRLARARFNLLDLHGVYDIVTTRTYNILPYFTFVPSFPDVGLGELQAEQNALMLERIAELARRRGIRVFVVSYQASWSIPDRPPPNREETEQNLGEYTTLAWEQLLERCPDVNGFGVRVGESGRGVLFYKRYVVPVLNRSESNHPLVLRSWLLSKEDIHTIGEDHKGAFAVEVKFNGDFLGLPYQVTGGRVSEWPEYTYRDLLSYPREYDVIFDVRAGGDHRVFPWVDIDSVRRTVEMCRLGGAFGMSLQPIGAYGAVSDTFSNTVYENLAYWTWTYERDWFWWTVWGRLAYQPDLPREIFEYHFQRHFPFLPPTYVRSTLQALEGASKVVPAIYATSCLGPDRRNMAPELETAATVADLYEAVTPFDNTITQSIYELSTHEAEGTPSGKQSPIRILERAVNAAERAVGSFIEVMELRPPPTIGSADVRVTPLERRRWKELAARQLDVEALQYLGRYHLAKNRSAHNLGLYRLTGSYRHLLTADELVRSSSHEWMALTGVSERRYRPFPDTLRMRTTQFHWLDQIPELDEDRRGIDQDLADWKKLARSLEWRPSFGHVPPGKSPPGEPLTLYLSIPSTVPVKGLRMRYRNSVGQGGLIDAQKSDIPDTYRVDIPGEALTEGLFEYFFSGEIGGHLLDSKSLMSGRYYRLYVTRDEEPPRIIRLQEQITEEHDNLVVVFDISDSSGIGKVRLWWKPFPASATWETVVLSGKATTFAGNVPLTPEGAMYFVEAIDTVGNATTLPNPDFETPFWIIEPWQAAKQE